MIRVEQIGQAKKIHKVALFVWHGFSDRLFGNP